MNTLLPLPLTDGALLVDNSFIESLTTCPRKAQYEKLMKRVTATEKPSLNFGSAIHLALEWRYRHCKNEQPTILDEAEQVKVLSKYFHSNPQPPDDHRTLNYAIELTQHYNQRYPIEPFHLLTDKDDKPLIELSFAVPLFTYDLNPTDIPGIKSGVIPIIYTGRIDLPCKWDDQIILIDHKTTSMLGDFFFDGQRVSPQFEGYCWAFEQTTGLSVSGFCINAIRSKAQPMKPDGGIAKWWDESFQRHKEYLKPGQLDEWKTNTIAHIEEFFYHYQNQFFPQRKKACTIYGKCPFYDVCYQQPDQRNIILKSDAFTNNEWSPLKQPV